jgi:hypothetical protein
MISFKLEKTGRWIRVPVYAVIVVALWIGLVVLFNVLVVQQGHAASPCMLKNVTGGMPCPTCGATRAAMDLAQGDLLSALWRNPLVLLAEVALLGWLCVRLVSGHSIRMRVAKAARPWLWWAAGLLVIANWAHVVVIDGPWSAKPEASNEASR